MEAQRVASSGRLRINRTINKVMLLCALIAIGAIAGVVQPQKLPPNGRLPASSPSLTAAGNLQQQHQKSSPQHVLLQSQSPLFSTQLKKGEERIEADKKKKKKKPNNRRKLYGRFLHITDIHPDMFYTPGASPSNACHTPIGEVNSQKKARPPPWGDDDPVDIDLAGVYGAPTTNCDTPQTLVDATFEWIKDHIMNPKDDSLAVDFVIWTGDSARHDNDLQRPRVESEVLGLNRMVAKKMYETFGSEEEWDENDENDFVIPVIPTLGNNDILPHNIFLPGPTALTKEYLNIWRGFVPEDQVHVFDRGAYFWRDVLANDEDKNVQTQNGGLAVISLNTLYFFSSNSAVDGCDLPSEPGYNQMEWLRVQLQLMRDKGMKAILIGHVPPARVREVGWKEGGRDDWEAGWGKRSWDETCWRKYVQWTSMYRDVITANIFGHMNLDHFILMDTKELERKHPKFSSAAYRDRKDEPAYKINSAEDYLVSLREGFSRLPRLGHTKKSGDNDTRTKKQRYLDEIGGEHAERFITNWVGPSIVPNYFPTLRIVEYNTTGLVDKDGYRIPRVDPGTHPNTSKNTPTTFSTHKPDELRKRDSEYDEDDEMAVEEVDEVDAEKKKKKKKKKPKKPKLPQPLPPSPTAPPGPAYSNQPFTLLGYKQFFANLTRINMGREPKWDDPEAHDGKDNSGKGGHKKPIDNTFRFELEYDTKKDKTYKLKDMTVRSCLELASKLVDARSLKKQKKQKKDKKKQKKEKNGVQSSLFGEFDRKGRPHKGHVHRKGNLERDRVFREFVDRAFVRTVKTAELDQIIGIGMHVLDPIDDGDRDEHRVPTTVEKVEVEQMGVGRKRPLEFMQGEMREGEMSIEDEVEVVMKEEKVLRLMREREMEGDVEEEREEVMEEEELWDDDDEEDDEDEDDDDDDDEEEEEDDEDDEDDEY